MAYNNKQHNTRFSGRYNTPGQFVAAGELVSGGLQMDNDWKEWVAPTPSKKKGIATFGQTPRKQQQQQQQQQQQNLQPVQLKDEDVKMDDVDVSSKVSKDDDSSALIKPYWMKSKLPGVKKVSNKERRRRQNENLRRLLTPKNALMVLNEMMPNDQVANQFKVEPSATTQFFSKSKNPPNFCADLTIDGNNYKGYGDNKLMARNAAAEQAIRDLIIKKMNKVINSDSSSMVGADVGADEETLPMIQLASFALHKLFSEWEYEGHKVPHLKPTTLSTSESAMEPVGKELPANAAQMHPCMLLTFMRPHLEYREVSVEGDRPQNMMFTLSVDVDGVTYVGKATNKKEARKLAARAACTALFGVQYDAAPNTQ